MKPKQERRLLERLYAKIPKMECIPGCSDCCGPVYGSREERKRAPLLATYEHKVEFMAEHHFHGADGCLTCPYVTPSGCGIYDDRPLICRVYGATEDPKLQCPHGRRPAKPLSVAELNQIWREYIRLDLGHPNEKVLQWARGESDQV